MSTPSLSPSSLFCHTTVGVFSLQGVRPTMEDEILTAENFFSRDKNNMTNHNPIENKSSLSSSDSPSISPSSPYECIDSESESSSSPGPYSLFCVFDGHGGVGAARFARQHVITQITNNLKKNISIRHALHNAFLETDELFRIAVKGKGEANSSSSSQSKSKSSSSDSTDINDTSGTTAVVCLLDHSNGHLYVANCGDSRCVIVDNSGISISMSRDHKADRPDEVERIRKAGGFVVHKRVMGELAISRAIGDLDFKEKGFTFVVADPEITFIQLNSQLHKYILIACDGLFDVMTNEMTAHFINKEASMGRKTQMIVEKIVRHAVEDLNTRDNVSSILVKLDYNEHCNKNNNISSAASSSSSPSSSSSSISLPLPLPISALPSSDFHPMRKISSTDDIKFVSFHSNNEFLIDESDEEVEGEGGVGLDDNNGSGNVLSVDERMKSSRREMKFNVSEEIVEEGEEPKEVEIVDEQSESMNININLTETESDSSKSPSYESREESP